MAAKNQAAAGAQQGAQPPQQGGGQAGSVPRGRGKPRQPNGSLRPGQMQQMPVVGGR
jgi:hypothetical protein